MPYLVLLAIIFGALFFLLHLPAAMAGGAACIATAVLWLAWKCRYVVLALIGLEFLLNE